MAKRPGVVGVTQTAVAAPATRVVKGVGPVVHGGRTEHFEAWFSPTLGEAGRVGAATVLNRAERDLTAIRRWCGDPTTAVSPLGVVLARLPDDRRADRIDGDPTTICCDFQTAPRPEPLQSSFLLATQLVFLAAGAVGWAPGISAALGRVLAAALYPRRVAGFATAAVWLDGARDPVVAGDLGSDPAALGGGVLFLNYLHHQLGFSWGEIASAPAASLGELAERLTGDDDTPEAFLRMLAAHFPPDQPSDLLTDNPFPLIASEPIGPRPAVRGGGERRVCLLTGASGTLGSFLCDAEADRYDFVAVHCRRPAPGGVFAVEADLLHEGECDRVVAAALERFGRIDLVVNAAVRSVWGPMLDGGALEAAAVGQFATNAVLPMRLACAVARAFWDGETEANRAWRRNVVNVSSISGQHLFPNEGQSVYAASKAALDHLTGHMALEFAALGVRVNAVAPNSFPSAVPLRRVVDAIVRLDEGESTGTIAVVDGDRDHVIPLTPG